MDRIALKTTAFSFLKKYRFALLVFALGIVLMLLPGVSKNETAEAEERIVSEKSTNEINQRLSQLLSQLKGAGKVEVLLTIAEGEKTVYQTDEDVQTGEKGTSRFDTVIVTDENRAQSGLIQQIDPPKYLGAIVLCQGADNATVRLEIVEAVSKATGLGADRISVLKMK